MPPKHLQAPLRGIYGLRGLAALAVFLVHFNQIVGFDVQLGNFNLYLLLANGENAVGLFIILSGFLLSLPFWRAILQEEPLPDLWVYLRRRACRIFPAYLLALLVLTYISKIWLLPGGVVDILLHFTFLFNFTEFTILSINPVFWTLAVEVQFYLLLPFIFHVVHKQKSLPWLWIFLAVSLVIYGLTYVLNTSFTKTILWPFNPWLIWIKTNGAVLYYSPLNLLPHFLLGLTLARLYLTGHRKTTGKQWGRFVYETIFFFCLVGLLVLLSHPIGDLLQVPYGRYGLPIIMWLIATLVFVTPQTKYAARLLEISPLRFQGVISYSFYIYHYPCLLWSDFLLMRLGYDSQQYWFLFLLTSAFFSTVVASLSYFLIEKPILVLTRPKDAYK